MMRDLGGRWPGRGELNGMRKLLAACSTSLLLVALPAAASVQQHVDADRPIAATSTPSASGAAPIGARGAAIGTESRSAAQSTGTASIDPFLEGELARGGEVAAIVNATTIDAAVDAINTVGLPVGKRFSRVAAAATVGPAEKIRQLATQSGVVYLEGNRPLDLTMETAVQATRIDVAEAEYDQPHEVADTSGKKGKVNPSGKTTTLEPRGDLTGEGVGVAIVDSGLAADHPMFAGRVIRNFRYGCTDVICDAPQEPLIDLGPTGDTDTPIGAGHGTHVSGIASGGHVTTSQGAPVRGAATGSSIYGFGSGGVVLILNAASSLDWILQHHEDPCFDMDPKPATCPAIRVVNNSYGGVREYNPDSLETKLSDALAKAGVVMVWAAGNGDATNNGGDGSDNRTNGPGASPVPGVVMVANYDDDDTGTRDGTLNSSSSRGEKGRPQTYPDISAPGSSITSACKPTLVVCHSHGNFSSGDLYYGTISGTSMAAPLVAGAVAELLQAYPDLTPGEVELAIENSAYKFGDPDSYEPDVSSVDAKDVRNPGDTTSFDKGHGLLDMANALRLLDKRAMDSRVPATCIAGGTVLSDPEGDATTTNLGGASTPGKDITGLMVTPEPDSVLFDVAIADIDTAAADGPGTMIEIAFRGQGSQHLVEFWRDALGKTRVDVDNVVTKLQVTFDEPTNRIKSTIPRSAFKPELGGLVSFSEFKMRSGTMYGPPATPLTNAVGLSLINDAAVGSACATFDVGGTAPTPPPPPPPPPPVQGDDPSSGSDGTASSGSAYGWDGEVPLVINPTSDGGLGCIAPDDPRCAHTRVLINVPTGGGTATVAITFPEGSDLELYVFGKDGARVGSSATGNPGETLTFTVPASGVYTVSVSSWVSTEAGYSGIVTVA